MPKLRETDQQKREKALMVAIARGAAEMELDTDKEVAEKLGMKPQNYSKAKKKHFQSPGFVMFCKMARILHFSGRELCTIVGVPYE